MFFSAAARACGGSLPAVAEVSSPRCVCACACACACGCVCVCVCVCVRVCLEPRDHGLE